MVRPMLLLIMVVASPILAGCRYRLTPQEHEMIEVVKAYEAASNEGDYEKAAEYLADDVVFITPPGGRIEGKKAWWEATLNDPNPVLFESENFQVDGDEVTWDTVVSSDAFVANARIVATVQDGKIVYYQATER